MNHQELSKKLCELTHQWVNNHKDEKAPILIDDFDFFKRQFYSRLYYALYHKCLQQEPNLSQSETPNKHQIIENRLRSTNDVIYQLFRKLKSLRIWADYKLSEKDVITTDSMKPDQYKTYKVIKQNFHF